MDDLNELVWTWGQSGVLKTKNPVQYQRDGHMDGLISDISDDDWDPETHDSNFYHIGQFGWRWRDPIAAWRVYLDVEATVYKTEGGQKLYTIARGLTVLPEWCETVSDLMAALRAADGETGEVIDSQVDRDLFGLWVADKIYQAPSYSVKNDKEYGEWYKKMRRTNRHGKVKIKAEFCLRVREEVLDKEGALEVESLRHGRHGRTIAKRWREKANEA